MTNSAENSISLAHEALANNDLEAAYRYASEGIASDAADVEIRRLRVRAAFGLERWQEALLDIAHLIAERPRNVQFRRLFAQCSLHIGNAYMATGNYPAAVAVHRRAVQVAPGEMEARFNLGNLLLEVGAANEALPLLAEVAQHLPTDPDAALQLAHAELACGAFERGATRLLDWKNRLSDDTKQRYCAELLLRARCDGDATALAERIAHDHAAAWSWCWKFAGHLRAKGDLNGSRSVLAVLRDSHTDPALKMQSELGIALGLPSVYVSTEEVHRVRAEFMQRLEAFTHEYTPQKVARILPKPEQLSWENFFLAYQGGNDLYAMTLFGDWLTTSLVALLPEFAVPPIPPPRARPRLAVVSTFFHECTVGFYFASWIEYLARQNWELFLVHVGTRRDALTERLSLAAHGELTLNSDLAENVRRLRELEADIVLFPEVGMDRDVFALAALRLAPHQVCAWGHPDTTGLPNMDVYLSCADMEPENASQFYREHLITLPGLGTRYTSPSVPEALSRELLGLPDSRTLYLVPQTLYKLHPDNDNVLVEIVRHDPSALFVLFEQTSPSGIRRVSDRLARALSPVSSEPLKHLHWFPECSRADYLRINLICAVMIDSLHWSGGNATLDALHCGLPVVTCPGQYMRGRQSASMLRALDCAELIARTPQELAEIAVSVAHDELHRAALSQRIQANLPRLIQSDAPLQALDSALQSLLGNA